MSKLIKLISTYHTESFDFKKAIKEVSGFSYDEKITLYDILINYGIPVQPLDENREDWELLYSILLKQSSGEESVP